MKTDVDIVFDLDGTLIDSAPHIATILSRISGRHFDANQVRDYLTLGGEQLITATLGADDLDRKLSDFRALYVAMPTPDCLYPGVRGGLDLLAAAGRTMAICSNKPQALCDKAVADLGLDHFALVLGSAAKPSPQPLTARLYVGDSRVDQQTAALSTIPFAFVTYGYAEPGFVADAPQFDSFAALVEHIL